MKLLHRFGLLLCPLFLWTTECTTSPTGRRQVQLLPDSQMAQMGDASFADLKAKQRVSNNPKYNQLVICITNRLLTVMGMNPQEWEVKVFEDPTPNAFALPGNNVGVHTGMITLVKNQDQLAAVIGHEIGHVLAHHGNERVSQSMLTQAGLVVADLVIGKNSKNDQLMMAALGLGAQVGILLPFSRKQEQEADRLGVEYMAKAGFDPRAAGELWKIMAQSGGKGPPEFLSTHPSNESRINDLTSYAVQFVPVYEQTHPKPSCGL
ncbi:MAG: M48 family metallopeptidase [Bdellovibrionales bacterium]|nr:M48 family metallopeptidase [Bdellovibrionales bacterium]